MHSGLLSSSFVVIVLCLIVSLVIHEFMHGYVGYLLGDNTARDAGRLSLNPLNHIDPFMTVILPILTLSFLGFPILAAKPVPFNPDRVKYEEFGAAIIAAAGPLTNLVLAIGASVVATNVLHVNDVSNSAWGVFAVLNVAIFVFNLIPIPPLDGSRVLYAFAPEAFQDFMRRIEPYGFFIILGLITLGGLNGFLSNSIQFVLNHLP